MKQLFIGLFTEGVTDIRFLEPIVKNTFINIAYEECKGQIDIELIIIEIDKSKKGFVEQILNASKKGIDEFGMIILCVQADADGKTLHDTYKNKISPAKDKLEKQNENEYCRIMVAIVPIQETEAWMLADKELLKSEIGTNIDDTKLGINKDPETIANPKEVIENAIRLARAGLTKKRRKDLTISELYLPIGVAMDLNKLSNLSSYNDFKKNAREAFIILNLLHS